MSNWIRVPISVISFWSVMHWRGKDSILTYPETAIAVVVIGCCVLAGGVFHGASLVFRVAVALGLVDFSLRVSAKLTMGADLDSLTLSLLTASLVVCSFLAALWLYPHRRGKRFDATVFFLLGSLSMAIGIRDTLGRTVSPYQWENVGLWALAGIALVFLIRLFISLHRNGLPRRKEDESSGPRIERDVEAFESNASSMKSSRLATPDLKTCAFNTRTVD